jgi:hypothetical protein
MTMSFDDTRSSEICNRGAEGKPRAARDVATGQSWTFPDHRSMAAVIAEDGMARLLLAVDRETRPRR